MLAGVIARLATFGYTTDTADETLINLLITKVTAEIKLRCNASELPSEIDALVVDIVTGEFLQHKKAIGAELGTINLEAVAESIKTGDITVDFGGSSNPETRFNALVSGLIISNQALITASLRRFDWS